MIKLLWHLDEMEFVAIYLIEKNLQTQEITFRTICWF